jgi:hypothetical protein
LRRALGLAVLLSAAVAAPAQVWEKLLAPGLTYRAEVDVTQPRMIHALRWTPGARVVQAVPELGLGVVYAEGATRGRETLSAMAQRTGAIAAINADFFPFTGDPLGLMVSAKELKSLPYPGRSVFGWGAATSQSAQPVARLTFTSDGGGPIPISQFNEACKANSITLNSERAGIAQSATANCVHAVLKVVEGKFQVGTKVTAEVQYLMSDSASIPIAPGNAFLTATGTMMPFIAGLRPGQRVTFDLAVDGFDWSKIDHVIGGGPQLVRNGAVSVDAAEQGFDANFTTRRHPRTAVGRTSEGDLWWVTIDGRQKLSDGATLEELARVMQRLGCQDAINLDGGGSTALHVLGQTVSRPSDGRERDIANAVVFLAPAPRVEDIALTMPAPVSVVAGTTTYLRVFDDKGNPIQNAEVIWSATGSGWIDQGGFLRATGEGTVFVSAVARGKVAAAGIQVTPAPPPKG